MALARFVPKALLQASRVHASVVDVLQRSWHVGTIAAQGKGQGTTLACMLHAVLEVDETSEEEEESGIDGEPAAVMMQA